MADLSITPASVLPGLNARLDQGFAGETITAGMAVYKAADGKWYKADANSGTPLARAATAIALCGSSANQPIAVQTSGQITIGATVVANTPYFLSDTAGGLGVLADIGTGEYGCLIGMAISTTVLQLSFNFTGVAN